MMQTSMEILSKHYLWQELYVFFAFNVITLRAKLSGAVYCYQSCLCACLLMVVNCLVVCVCGSVTTITLNSVHRSSPNWVCR